MARFGRVAAATAEIGMSKSRVKRGAIFDEQDGDLCLAATAAVVVFGGRICNTYHQMAKNVSPSRSLADPLFVSFKLCL